MISKNAVKLLKWLDLHDQWMEKAEIKQEYKRFTDRDFSALLAVKFLSNQLALDGSQWARYRISDSGKAYLEGLNARRISETRAWINTWLSLFTFIAGVLVSEPVKAFFRWIWGMLC